MLAIPEHERSEIDQSRPLPLYHQVYSLLRRKIEGGELRHGALLPSEIELASQLGVSRVTAKRALDDLEAEGYVERRRGRGTAVTWRYEPRLIRAPLNGMLEGLAVMGKETRIGVLSFDQIAAPKNAAEALRLLPGSPVQRAVRLRYLDGLPFAHYTSWTRPLGPAYNANVLKDRSRLELFKTLGFTVVEVDQVLSACGAPPDAALALGVSPGTPLLSVSRTYIDQHARPIDHLIGLYRPDRFQYHMKLSAKR